MFLLQVEAAMEAANRVVSAVRGLRSQYGLQRQKPAVSLAVSQSAAADALEACAGAIATLSLSSSVTVLRVSLSLQNTIYATTPCHAQPIIHRQRPAGASLNPKPCMCATALEACAGAIATISPASSTLRVRLIP